MTRLMMRTTPAIMSSRAFDQFFESFFTQPDQWVKNSTEGYPLTDIWREEDDTQVITERKTHRASSFYEDVCRSPESAKHVKS
jgi:hypothetical protein